MKISKYIAIPLIGTALIMLSACKDFLEESILDRTVLNAYIKTDTEAVTFFYGAFYHMRNMAFGQNYLSTYELPTDQTYFTSSDDSRRRMSLMDYYANTTFVQNVWESLYKVIGQMNILIDKLETGVLQHSKYTPRLIAQARFLKAYCYFDAVRLWGAVPIVPAYYNASGDIKPARSSVDKVYEQIIDDLKYGLEENRLRDFDVTSGGAKIMPDTVVFRFPDDAVGTGSNYFLPVSKGAAQLLLAKVYLTRNASGDHALAESLVDELIAKSRPAGGAIYDLLPAYGNLFQVDTKTSPNRCREVLFELEASEEAGNNTTHRQIGINKNTGIKLSGANNSYVTRNTSGYGYYRPTEYFVSSYDGMKDKRYFWLFQIVRETDGPHYRKGRDHVTTHNDNGYCNAVLLRFSDAYLIKAELRARANDPGGMKAAIDPVLARAGLDPYDTSGKSQEDMIDDVLSERAKEFALEAGNRLFDMRRTGFKAAMDKYDAWYNANVKNSTRTNPSINNGNPTCLLMNPLVEGNPVIVMMDDPDNPGSQIENPRQDQAVGGDYFEYSVPFVTSYTAEKKYSQKCEFHPIPTRELMQNPNLNASMNIPDWN